MFILAKDGQTQTHLYSKHRIAHGFDDNIVAVFRVICMHVSVSMAIC